MSRTPSAQTWLSDFGDGRVEEMEDHEQAVSGMTTTMTRRRMVASTSGVPGMFRVTRMWPG